MTEKVLATIERETGQTVTAETPIDELQVDSLEYLELLLTIQEETGMTLPGERMDALETVGDIVRELV